MVGLLAPAGSCTIVTAIIHILQPFPALSTDGAHTNDIPADLKSSGAVAQVVLAGVSRRVGGGGGCTAQGVSKITHHDEQLCNKRLKRKPNNVSGLSALVSSGGFTGVL